MKYALIPCLVLSLTACDFMPFKSLAQQTCKEIAIDRLKHPGSYDYVSVSEKTVEGDQIEVYLNFKAWNDFKVPMLQSISCRFQNKDNSSFPDLLSIKWNGHLIRRHELDDIRESLKN